MKHKNLIKKVISFLTILCCLAGSLIPAYAAESDSGSGAVSGAPRVTFTNEPNNSPDLFVNKVVENAVSGAQYAAPEHAAYRFVLKIGGKIAANEEYRLLDSEYGEITRKTSMGNTFSFKTDSSGVFTLEDGQQAWFEYVGTGVKYEVIELDTYLCPVTDDAGREVPVSGGYRLYDEEGNLIRDEIEYQMRSLSVDGYRQVSPPGNAADGASTGEKSILANGSSETFTNRYTGKGTGDTTVLEISKSVSFPAGYTVPETPDFRFRVELDGSAYAGKEYTVTDTASGNPVIDAETGLPLTGITDAEGCFTLKGGQTASFQEIPTELDYKVYELLQDSGEAAAVNEEEDGENGNTEAAGDAAEDNVGIESGAGSGKWWAVGGTEHKGSTQAPLTEVNFNNANVSFVVTKRMEDYSKPDIEFTFRLADEKNNALTGAAYYLYNTTGVPVYDENGNPLTGITDAEGSFKLKPGQAAVFTGIEPGKSFQVSETKNPDYVQVLPLPTNDTIYTVPAGGQIPVVDFVNKPADNTGSLTVTKEVTYKDGEGSLTNEDFHFVLYKQLKTETDVKKALGVVDVLVFTIGSADGEAIEAAAADGSIVLVEADLSDGSSAGVPSEISDSIVTVEDVCYYTKDERLYELYAPAENAVYSVPEGLSAPTYKTGSGSNAGAFSIKAGQTAQFELLAVGYKYLVREFGLTAEYTEVITESRYYKKIYVQPQASADTGSGEEDTGADADTDTAAGQYGQTAELTGSGLSFLFTNQYEAKKVNLNLTKADAEGNAITEAPAYFMLYLDKGQENPVYEDAYLSTDDQGMLTFPELKPGTYWLYELKAPSGYRLLESPIEIHIAWGEDGNLEVTIDGRPLDEDSDVVINGQIKSQAGQNGQDAQEGIHIVNDTICITVLNKEFYKLPSTGGVGIYWYSIGGMLLMMAAALILYKYKRTEEVQGD